MLAIDWHQFGAWCRSERLDHRARSNEAFFVCKRQALSGSEGLNGDLKTSKSDDTVDHDICFGNQCRDVAFDVG